MNNSTFKPDWASSPGETIADILRLRKISKVDFAEKIGINKLNAEALLQGSFPISISLAKILANELGASTEFWVNRDCQYREAIKRIQEENKEWIRELPINDMVRFGWISKLSSIKEQVIACLSFFQVPTIRAWREDYLGVQQITAFRTSPKFDSRTAAVATWLRQGEIIAETIECEPWNPSKFEELLPSIKKLTWVKDPAKFLPKLQSLCAECGVAVVIARSPSGCTASGATRFLSKTKGLLLLSFRYLSDDQFWFTFFHEAGHLILHQHHELFLEGIDSSKSIMEEEANGYAARTLIPQEYYNEFIRLRSYDGILRFSTKIGLAPGIVLGQLQYLGKVDPGYMNKLKRRYIWGDDISGPNLGKL